MSYSLVLGCLGVAGIAVWISAKFFRHPLSPFGVFYGIWFAALALYNMNWIAYTPVRRPAWVLIGLNLAAFGIGWIIPYLGWNPRDFQNSDVMRHQVSADRLLKVIGICFVLGVIGLAAFFYAIHSTLGLDIYINNPPLIRAEMAAGGSITEGIKPFNWLNVTNVALTSIYLFVLRGPRRRLVWPVLVFSLVAALAMEDRMRFFYATVWTGFILLHSIKVSAKQIVVGVTLGIMVLLAEFIAMATFMGKVAENNAVLMQSASIQDAALILLPPYMYATESFPALQAYMDTGPKSTHGSMTFYPIFKLLNLVDPTIEPPLIVAEFVSIPIEANTFTWLQQFYDDFGIVGVLIGPWVVGVVSSAVYFRMLRTREVHKHYVMDCFFFVYCSIISHDFTQGKLRGTFSLWSHRLRFG